MSIGEKLKSAREHLGFDERSASERTRIRRHYIIAMENDDFDSIDLAPVYRIGFLRIYAKLLKLDADAIVAEFKETQNAKSSGTRSIFRPSAIKASVTENEAEDLGFPGSSLTPPAGSGQRRTIRLVAAAAVAVLAILAISLLFVKTCSSTESDEGSIPTAELTREERIAYEIEVSAITSQKITIQENYKGWDNARGTPIAGAIVMDEYIPAGRTKKLVVHGTLYIREEVLKGCKIKYPSASAFQNVGAANKIILDATSRQINATTNSAWLIEPWKK